MHETQSSVSQPTHAGLGLARLAYTLPTAGAIRMGGVSHRTVRGREMRLPVAADEFFLTTPIKTDPGTWERHSMDASLREKYGESVPDGQDGVATRKLRSIPVRIVYDHPDLTMSEQFAAFDEVGSPLCVGNGVQARRASDEGVHSVECPGPASCAYGREARCDAFMRLQVQLRTQADSDPPFILRTGSINAISQTRATLMYWHSMFGSRLAGLPMQLQLVAKQSAASHHTPFWYARLVADFDVLTGAKLIAQRAQEHASLGVDTAAAERMLLAMRANSAFNCDALSDPEQFDDLLAAREQALLAQAGAPTQTRITMRAQPEASAGAANADPLEILQTLRRVSASASAAS